MAEDTSFFSYCREACCSCVPSSSFASFTPDTLFGLTRSTTPFWITSNNPTLWKRGPACDTWSGTNQEYDDFLLFHVIRELRRRARAHHQPVAMGITELLQIPDMWTMLFFCIVAGIIGYFYFSNTFNSTAKTSLSRKESQDGRSSRRISPIREADESEAGRASPSIRQYIRPSTLDTGGAVPAEKRRMRKRDWVKKVYRSLIQADDSPPNQTPPGEENEGGDGNGGSGAFSSRRGMSLSSRRRHSTSGPLQFAKDLVRGKRSYFRQSSDFFTRDALPRPPVEFFEPSELPEIPQNLSPEIFYILHNLKMLELPSEWKLDPRDIEVKSYHKDEIIARPGDPDDSIYVPVSGSCAVYIAHHEGKEYMVKHIATGNSFFSLLSMLDVLVGYDSILRTVSLRAFEPCRVAKYSIRSFAASYAAAPHFWTRPIQIVVTRLLHVTMTTLNHYMGLSGELMKMRATAGLPTSHTADSVEQSLSGGTAPLSARHRHGSGQGAGERCHLGQSVRLAQNNRPKYARTMSMNVDGAAAAATAANGTSVHSASISPQVQQQQIHPLDQMAMARKWFAEALGMGAAGESFFEGRLRLQTYQEGQYIVEQGYEEENLYLVIQGCVRVIMDSGPDDNELQTVEESEEERCASQLYSRELLGGLQMLTQEPSFYTFKAATYTVLAVMDKPSFNTLSEEFPKVYLPVAHSVLRRLSSFVRGVDFALDWVLVDSGQAVYRAGDVADSLYVVLSGRLRSVEKKTVIEEFGRGDMLGMMEVLQRRPRTTTVLAVRFSQLARVPEGLLNFIKMQYPQVGFRLVQLLGQYYSSMSRRATGNLLPASIRSFEGAPGDPMSHIKNLHTIAVVPASPDVPLVAFNCELYHALSANLRVLRLSSTKVAAHLDAGVLEKQADFRLMHWLNVQEDTYPLVIYECDYTATNWTRRCLRQADAILVVALGTHKPPKQAFMEEHLNINQDGIRTNKELILLWPEDTTAPSGTYEYLAGSWFSGHHHIRAPSRMFQWNEARRLSPSLSRTLPPASPAALVSPVSRIATTEADVIEYYEQNVFWEKVNCQSDFARLARILTGNAIGLVLGGGGARGAAHVGVIRAMKECGIPVDIVGGTSIGSMIGGIYAETPQAQLVEDRARGWFEIMTSLWRKIWDITYWHSAMFTGSGFNSTLQTLFGEREIEDLWIPYFCISTDISTSQMRVHRSGPLWAYCRASMSLAGYLPPLCDPADGHLLLDGGYVNNLPADVMRSMGARCVIAVDVGSATETNLFNYGQSLSGAWVLLNRLNPWAEKKRILNMEEIQSRLAFVSCVRQLEMVKKAPYCHYLRPPIEPFLTLEFGKYDTIMEVGSSYARSFLAELVATNKNLHEALGENAKLLTRRATGRSHNKRLGIADRSLTSSFTDLAAQIGKIPKVNPRRRQMSLTALDDEDLYLCDSEGEYAMSSDFADASESEDEPFPQGYSNTSFTPTPAE